MRVLRYLLPIVSGLGLHWFMLSQVWGISRTDLYGQRFDEAARLFGFSWHALGKMVLVLSELLADGDPTAAFGHLVLSQLAVLFIFLTFLAAVSEDETIPWLAAVFWSLHPSSGLVVTELQSLPLLLALAFLLLMCLSQRLSYHEDSPNRFTWSALAVALGLLSILTHPVGLIAPLLGLITAYAFNEDGLFYGSTWMVVVVNSLSLFLASVVQQMQIHFPPDQHFLWYVWTGWADWHQGLMQGPVLAFEMLARGLVGVHTGFVVLNRMMQLEWILPAMIVGIVLLIVEAMCASAPQRYGEQLRWGLLAAVYLPFFVEFLRHDVPLREPSWYALLPGASLLLATGVTIVFKRFQPRLDKTAGVGIALLVGGMVSLAWLQPELSLGQRLMRDKDTAFEWLGVPEKSEINVRLPEPWDETSGDILSYMIRGERLRLYFVQGRFLGSSAPRFPSTEPRLSAPTTSP